MLSIVPDSQEMQLIFLALFSYFKELCPQSSSENRNGENLTHILPCNPKTNHAPTTDPGGTPGPEQGQDETNGMQDDTCVASALTRELRRQGEHCDGESTVMEKGILSQPGRRWRK